MSRKQLRDFLSDLKEILHPNPGANIPSPKSPPDWTQLGWKVGWIAGEAHGGPQFFLTEEQSWGGLTRDFGEDRSQKIQVFSRRYQELLDQLAGELGKPVNLQSVKWRKIDCTALPGSTAIENEQWWQIPIRDKRLGEWTVLWTGRFHQVFEIEKESPPEPRPPWTFEELWVRLNRDQQTQLLERLGREKGLLNHLSGLIAAGTLEGEQVLNKLPRTPSEELQTFLGDRRAKLQQRTPDARRRTQNEWKKQANETLVHRVGEWLESGTLSGEDWQEAGGKWDQYRFEQRKHRFDNKRWKILWSALNERHLRQVVPRLDVGLLRSASVGLPRVVRSQIAAELNDRRRSEYEDEWPPSVSEVEVYEARERLYNRLDSMFESMDLDRPDDWE